MYHSDKLQHYQHSRNSANLLLNFVIYAPPVDTHPCSKASSTYFLSFPSKFGIDNGINLLIFILRLHFTFYYLKIFLFQCAQTLEDTLSYMLQLLLCCTSSFQNAALSLSKRASILFLSGIFFPSNNSKRRKSVHIYRFFICIQILQMLFHQMYQIQNNEPDIFCFPSLDLQLFQLLLHQITLKNFISMCFKKVCRDCIKGHHLCFFKLREENFSVCSQHT